MTLMKILSVEELEEKLNQQEELILNLRFALAEKNKVLMQIENWELPDVHLFYDEEHKRKMSYEACYGSRGVEKYFRQLATDALKP